MAPRTQHLLSREPSLCTVHCTALCTESKWHRAAHTTHPLTGTLHCTVKMTGVAVQYNQPLFRTQHLLWRESSQSTVHCTVKMTGTALCNTTNHEDSYTSLHFPVQGRHCYESEALHCIVLHCSISLHCINAQHDKIEMHQCTTKMTGVCGVENNYSHLPTCQLQDTRGELVPSFSSR